jgi:hypothetical protein
MAENDALVIICSSCQVAEKAVRRFQAAHFNVQKISVIGRDSFDACDAAENSPSGGKKPLPDESAFWARLWQLLPGDAFLRIKGIGPIIVSGPISQTMREVGTNPKFPHACSPLRTCMLAIGISTERLHRYEAALRSGHFLVVVRGSRSHIRAAEKLLHSFSSGSEAKENPVDQTKEALLPRIEGRRPSIKTAAL